jgi:DNA primase
MPEVKYDDEKIKEQKKKRSRLMEALRETALFYVKNLKSDKGAQHLDYAGKRKFSGETLTKFGMGASLDFNSLPQYLRSKGAPTATLENTTPICKPTA